MHQLFRILSSLLRVSQPDKARAFGREPLDHPCLSDASRAFLDDLPLPAFAIARDGTIIMLAEA
jgi:hypothetical protein